MSVAECQRRVSSREFSEWIALADIEPWGERRNDWQVALLASTIVNIFRGQDDTAAEPSEYLVYQLFDEAREAALAPEEEQQEALADKIMAAFMRFQGAEDRRGQN